MLDQFWLSEILRKELDKLLRDWREKIIEAPYGKPVFMGKFEGSERAAIRADLEGTDWAIKRLSADLARWDLHGPE